MPSIVLIDRGTKTDPALLRDIAEAVTIQIAEHFSQAAPNGWGCDGTVRVGKSETDIQPGEWVCELRDPDVQGALGYHNITPEGTPALHIFPSLLDDPASELAGVISHEVLEALGDPLCGDSAVGLDGVIKARESCDPVENDSYPIKVSSGATILVSNFILLTYLEPPEDLTNVKLDWMGLVKFPGEIRPGGYLLVLKDGQWTQETAGELRPYRQRLTDRGLGRGTRRRANTVPQVN